MSQRKTLGYAVLAAGILLGVTSPAMAATHSGTKTVNVTVPAKIVLSVDAAAVNLTADPAAVDGANESTGAAVVGLQTNSKTGAKLSVQAAKLSNGSAEDDIAASALKFRATGGGAWSDFAETAADIVGNAPKGVSSYTYDYHVDRNWAYSAGNYSTTVTYTATTL